MAAVPEEVSSGTTGLAGDQSQTLQPPALPPRRNSDVDGEDISSVVHYTRDPKKLIAYIVPFPKPTIKHVNSEDVPTRFLIYTPPPPPFMEAPAEGEREGRVQKVQRKWMDEVRDAKTSNAKVTSWKGMKGRATKGVDWAMGQTKSSSLEFLNRIPGMSSSSSGSSTQKQDKHADDGQSEGDTTKKTVGLEEMVLIYPPSIAPDGSQEKLREEFVNSMLRTKSKAQRDAILATGLMPVSFGIDLLATVIWPFGGLLEIDAVWAAASMRGAKTARSVTKRLASSNPSTQDAGASGQPAALDPTANEKQLHLNFIASQRNDILVKYLAAECHKCDLHKFPSPGAPPTETDVLNAIGWQPSRSGGGETRNWEDEQWELKEVKEDLKQVMHKAAKEWDKWSKAFAKNPEKAMKK